MAANQKIFFVLIVVALLLVSEAKRIYVKPHPSAGAKRSTDILSQLGKIHRTFPEINGYVIEVKSKI